MRLIHADTITLTHFQDDRALPPYAILSHTWGDDEVTFQQMLALSEKTGPSPSALRDTAGYLKIVGTCRRALEDGLAYVWVDTCCIDKTSSAELSEAINSMFRWYQGAKVCYAYLADVEAFVDVSADDASAKTADRLAGSRWFTRGWTLQELIAPRDVEFFDAEWNHIGSKAEHVSALERITGIGWRILRDSAAELPRTSVAQRMAWAAGRRTTRREDRAYSLLGIFGINMPLLYGEGDKAFVRLQEEIMRVSDDQSLFAWGLGNPLDERVVGGEEEAGWGGGLFATTPDAFASCSSIVFWGSLSTSRPSHYHITNKGLRIELPLLIPVDLDAETVYAILDCMSNNKFIALPLSRAYHEDVYQRTRGAVPRAISSNLRKRAVRQVIYIQTDLPGGSLTMYFSLARLITKDLSAAGYRAVDAFPPHAVLRVSNDEITCGDAHRLLLLFQTDAGSALTGGRGLATLAMLITFTYKTGDHDLSRPVLDNIDCKLGTGLRRSHFAEFVTRQDLAQTAARLRMRDAVQIGARRFTAVTLARTSVDWTIGVEVEHTGLKLENKSSELRLVRRPTTVYEDSDSEGFENVSIQAIASMYNNTNRDWRQRQQWVRRQRRGWLTWCGVQQLWVQEMIFVFILLVTLVSHLFFWVVSCWCVKHFDIPWWLPNRVLDPRVGTLTSWTFLLCLRWQLKGQTQPGNFMLLGRAWMTSAISPLVVIPLGMWIGVLPRDGEQWCLWT